MMLSTAEVVNELQALAQRATKNELPLVDLAEQLSALAKKARAACTGKYTIYKMGEPSFALESSGTGEAPAQAQPRSLNPRSPYTPLRRPCGISSWQPCS